MKNRAVLGCLLAVLTLCQCSFAGGTVAVSTQADIVDGDTSSLSALIANPGSDGLISLREAFIAAEKTPSATNSPNTVNLPGGIYKLSKGELTLGNKTNSNTVIIGPVAGPSATIQQTASARVLDLNSNLAANVRITIQNVTITGGTGVSGGGGIAGGGVSNQLVLANCIIAGNQTAIGRIGGGISWSGGGDLTANSCVFSNNVATSAVGGAICFNNGNGNPGSLSVSNTLFSNNQATGGAGAGQGGALFVSLDSGSSAYINQCTFSNNVTGTPSSQGGAVYVSSGSIVIRNGQYSGDSAAQGADTFNNGGATLTILNEYPPQITVQPLSLNALIGTPATFSVTALSSNTIGYQWLSNNVPLSNNSRVTGATTNTLVIHLVTPSDQAVYSVVVGNINGSVTSSNVQLTVALVYPKFSSSAAKISGPQATFTGTAGAPGGQYTVLTSTNIAALAPDWTPLSTNTFDATGAFLFNDTLTPTQPIRFYKLRIP